MSAHVAIIGAGPAGLAAAAALSDRGVATTIIDPHPNRAWPARYGMWAHQAAQLGIQDHVRRTWRDPQIVTADGPRRIGTPYVLIDNEALRRHLLARLQQGGRSRILQGRVHGMIPGPPHTVMLEQQSLTADVVVDASGASPILAPRSTRPRSWQSAYGILAEVDTHPWSDDEMVLMDFRHPFGTPSSFLYALPMGGSRVFLEETVLSSSEPLPYAVLASRLDDRLRSLGIRITRRVGEERVCIPMGQGLAPESSDVVAFGAASGLIHPATGYSLATTLELAPHLAQAIHLALERGALQEATRDAWQAILPPSRRRAHRLTLIGHEVFEHLEPDLLARALSAFFGQPTSWWMSFMSGTSQSLARLRGMAGTGLHLGLRDKARVAQHLLSLGLSPWQTLLQGDAARPALVDQIAVAAATEDGL